MAVILAAKTDESGTPSVYTLGYDNLYFMGQSINGIEGELDSVVFRIANSHTATGPAHLEAAVYTNLTGTVSANNAKPTADTPIAISNAINLPTSVGSGAQDLTFMFSGADRINLNALTDYVVALRYIRDVYDSYVSVTVYGGTSALVGNYSAKKTTANFSHIASVDMYTEIYVEDGVGNTPHKRFDGTQWVDVTMTVL